LAQATAPRKGFEKIECCRPEHPDHPRGVGAILDAAETESTQGSLRLAGGRVLQW